MTPSNPLTDNMIGWVPMNFRVAVLNTGSPGAADIRSGSMSTTAKTGLVTDRCDAMDALVPAPEAPRAGK